MYNIYSDESCHLLDDNSNIMVLGAICCPNIHARKINREIRKIKEKYKIGKNKFGDEIEIKWTKVSSSKMDMYKELISLFFEKDYLKFRAVIINGKSELDHVLFMQDHDTWYHKMYYYLFREMVKIGNEYNIYVDIKDTRSSENMNFLKGVLNRSLRDSYKSTVRKIQPVRSEEVNILQLTDLFIGALSYKFRNLKTSDTKLDIVNYIEMCSEFDLSTTTPRYNDKFNLFVWVPRRNSNG